MILETWRCDFCCLQSLQITIMLHFSQITANNKSINLIASGALAFKISQKILKDAAFAGFKIKNSSMLCEALDDPKSDLRFFDGKKVFFAIISDLDTPNCEALGRVIAKARKNGSYAVCEIITMFYNERFFKAMKHLKQNFNETIELNKLLMSNSRSLTYTEQQNCQITDFSTMFARMLFNTSGVTNQVATQAQVLEPVLKKAV